MYVLSGTKVFYICPPADALVLKQQEYPSGSFVKDQHGEWKVRLDTADDGNAVQRVRWIGVDPTILQDESRHGAATARCHVLEVHVKAGEMLYLPSLWFHKVTQTCETVAINYWYDMQFDAKWCYFEFMNALEAVSAPVDADRASDGVERMEALRK
jgi:peptidyl-lysine (3S)-dioxygenase / protease